MSNDYTLKSEHLKGAITGYSLKDWPQEVRKMCPEVDYHELMEFMFMAGCCHEEATTHCLFGQTEEDVSQLINWIDHETIERTVALSIECKTFEKTFKKSNLKIIKFN